MKYLVRVEDADTGEMCVRKIPTTKSHAKQWANQYIQEGRKADIIPWDSEVSRSDDCFKCAFEAEKDHRWDLVKIRFSWRNMEDQIVSTYMSMRELYADWFGECVHCPGNDTVVFDVKVGTSVIPNEAIKGLLFGELMTFVDKTWPPHKKGPRRAGSEPAKKKSAFRKRGRPIKARCNGI